MAVYTKDLTHPRQGDEPVLIETLIAKPAVEAFDESVLRWLARFDESKLDALVIGPRIENSTRELGPVVDDDLLRVTPQRCDRF